MRAVTTVAIAWAIVGAGIVDVRREIGRDWETSDRFDPAPEVRMDRRGIASVEAGITDTNGFASARQVESRAHDDGGTYESGGHVVARTFDGALTNLPDTMHGREPIELRFA